VIQRSRICTKNNLLLKMSSLQQGAINNEIIPESMAPEEQEF
jgi:hypothetical protein